MQIYQRFRKFPLGGATMNFLLQSTTSTNLACLNPLHRDSLHGNAIGGIHTSKRCQHQFNKIATNKLPDPPPSATPQVQTPTQTRATAISRHLIPRIALRAPRSCKMCTPQPPYTTAHHGLPRRTTGIGQTRQLRSAKRVA